jgi:hypothetical protein
MPLGISGLAKYLRALSGMCNSSINKVEATPNHPFVYRLSHFHFLLVAFPTPRLLVRSTDKFFTVELVICVLNLILGNGSPNLLLSLWFEDLSF